MRWPWTRHLENQERIIELLDSIDRELFSLRDDFISDSDKLTHTGYMVENQNKKNR